MERLLVLSWQYILFYIVTALWIGEFLVFPSKYESEDYSEISSFKKILAGVLLSIVITVGLSYLDIFRVEGSIGSIAHYLGIGLYLIGIVLRYSGSIYLGKYFTRDVNVSEDQELVSDGPYKILRHPLYLGLFLLTISVPLFFQNYLALLVSLMVMANNINKRMVLEEASMEDVMGERYRLWKSSRYRFIPFIY